MHAKHARHEDSWFCTRAAGCTNRAQLRARSGTHSTISTDTRTASVALPQHTLSVSMVSTSQLRVCYRFRTGLRPVLPVQVRASGPYLQFGTGSGSRQYTVDAQSPTHALKLLEPKLIFLNLTVLLRSPTALLKPALLKPTVVATADLLQLREVLARDIHLDCTVDLLLSGMLPRMR